MRNILAATIMAVVPLAAAHAAHAGDIGLAGETYDWSGAYLGVNAGGAMDDVQVKRHTVHTGPGILPPAAQEIVHAARDNMSADDSGFTGGVSGGYNWQVDQVVFGIEADLNPMSLSGTMRKDVTGSFGQIIPDNDLHVVDKVEYNIDSYGTVRGRLGFAMDNVLFYGTGGLAYGHTRTDSQLAAQYSTGATSWKTSSADWSVGWTAGGGVEYGIGRWSLGLEYLYVDLMPVDWTSPSRRNLAAKWDMDYSVNVVRATGKVRF